MMAHDAVADSDIVRPTVLCCVVYGIQQFKCCHLANDCKTRTVRDGAVVFSLRLGQLPYRFQSGTPKQRFAVRYYAFSGVAMGWAGWAKSRGVKGPPSSRQIFKE